MATVSILFSTFGICVAVVSSSTNWKVTHKVLGFDSQMSSVQNPANPSKTRLAKRDSQFTDNENPQLQYWEV